jgi:DNA invertase Pin-like site-specific DNA recombinase
VGIVLGIEMSRLARSGREWHQLLELCALSGALLGDLDGVYDPAEHNDRLVRHEVLRDRTEVKDHRRRAIAVVR